MKYKKSILIICLLIFFASILTVSANDVNDTIINSNEPQQVIESSNDYILSKSDDGTFTALQKKIDDAKAGSTITLENDYKYDEGFSKKGIEIDKDLTINGNGHTIDGLLKSRIFLVKFKAIKNNQVTLNNIEFVNAESDLYGGAIFNYANLTVNNCKFINNYAKYCGGAICSIGNLNCKNSKFTTNLADGDGGAIFCLSLERSVDLENLLNGKILDGNINFINDLTSIITIKFAKETISNCAFNNNIANGRGGGAVYAFGHIDIKSSTFNSNAAGANGGAVFANMDLYISNSAFTSNQVSKNGGAVYFRCHQSSGHYDENKKWVSEVKYHTGLIQDSTFTKNVAAKGGAIYGFKSSAKDSHEIKAERCTFTDNKATADGRDIYGGSASKCVFNYLKLTLKTIKVKKSAKKLVLTAKLTKGKSFIKGKKVTFKFNGKTYKAKTNKKGIAKVTIKKNVLKKLKVGKKVKYQAKYSNLTVKKSAKVQK